jgi:hypothetical protein
MRSSDPLFPIRHLIGEPGFSTKDDLADFCLSVGLFQDIKGKTRIKPPRSWNPQLFTTWPMLQVIAYTKEPSIKDVNGIRDFLYQYYIGGVVIIVKKVFGKGKMEALKELSKFIPP